MGIHVRTMRRTDGPVGIQLDNDSIATSLCAPTCVHSIAQWVIIFIEIVLQYWDL